ncbi:hypothetical protein DLH72_02745 [Candidatus Gracilibacteria bacterium]|nr:MAG: hypothetical protein DLH72_02745 [Candidatus Gracilibacteria bacterium]
MKNLLKNTNLFTIITKIILVILPFYVFLSLSLKSLTGFNLIGFFLKEFLLILAFFLLIFEFIKAKKFPKLDILDFLILAFFVYGIIITFVNGLGFKSLFYGGRYDFIFFVAFLIYKHGSQFLKESKKNLIKIFLASASISLFFGIFIKFIGKEDFLLLFGYTEYIGNWVYNGGVPNYHGLENSGIKRFQGILDGPNAMGFFLIIYTGFFIFLQKNKKEFYVFLFLIFTSILLYLTFSRSAVLGVLSGTGIIFLLNLKYLFKNYKKTIIGLLATFGIVGILALSLFSNQLKNIILRESSTEGHFSRMKIGIERFVEKPFGAGLAESGPAFRNIYPEKQNLEGEHYYIPESWFIQILVEGGIIYFLLFLSILGVISFKIYKKSIIILGVFIAIIVMNIFLHIFEATYLSILLFILIGLILYKD